MPLFIPTLIFAISLSLLPSAGPGHVNEGIAHKQRKISSQKQKTTAEASEAVMGLQDARTLNHQNDQSRRISASASDAESGGVVKTDDCWIRTSFRDDQRLGTGHVSLANRQLAMDRWQ